MAKSERPLWQALHESGFSHAEVRRVVHTFTRKINADMKVVVGNKVLFQWEQDMEAFLKDKEDPDARKERDVRSDRGNRGHQRGSNPRTAPVRGKKRRPRDGRAK